MPDGTAPSRPESIYRLGDRLNLFGIGECVVEYAGQHSLDIRNEDGQLWTIEIEDGRLLEETAEEIPDD